MMNIENPYAAPQIAEFAVPVAVVDGEWTPEHALGPEWRTVCAGAKKCYISVVTVFLSILFGFLASIVVRSFLRSPQFASFIGYSMWVAFFVAWVFQLVGLIQLRRVALWSGAKGLLSTAFGTFLLSWVGYVVFMIVMVGSFAFRFSQMAAPGQQARAQLNSSGTDLMVIASVVGFGLAIVYLAYHVTLLLGMRKIGFALKHNAIARNSLVALILFAVIIVGYIGFAATSFATSTRSSSFFWLGILPAIGIFITFLVMIAFYGSALKKIADHAKSP